MPGELPTQFGGRIFGEIIRRAYFTSVSTVLKAVVIPAAGSCCPHVGCGASDFILLSHSANNSRITMFGRHWAALGALPAP